MSLPASRALPATVAAAVQSHDPIVIIVRLLALDPQIALAAEFDGRVAHFHANALAAAFYPTAIRATGVGWALGIGRVGSIVGPLVGGALLSMKWSAAEVFMTAAGAALCAAVAALSLSRLANVRGSGDGAVDPSSAFDTNLRPSTTAGV